MLHGLSAFCLICFGRRVKDFPRRAFVTGTASADARKLFSLEHINDARAADGRFKKDPACGSFRNFSYYGGATSVLVLSHRR
jgi:hypothetical protein